MKRLDKTQWFATMVAMAAVLALSACASSGPGKMTTRTSEPAAVNADEDNARLMAGLEPQMVVTLEVDGTTARLIDARVLMVRGNKRAAVAGQDHVVVRGLSAGQAISETKIPDQRINTEHDAGLVIVEKRQLAGALPLPRRIDTLEVMVPGAADAVTFDVGQAIGSFCKDNSQFELCRGR